MVRERSTLSVDALSDKGEASYVRVTYTSYLNE